jgi:hypothetical protein
MVLTIHVAAGGLAIVLGAVALLAKKGGTVHRRGGLLFVFAMLVMGFSASLLGLRQSLTDPNVFAGLMTAYFVGTALLTVRPATAWTRSIGLAALPVPVGLGLAGMARAVEAFNSPGRALNGVPFLMHAFLATVLLLAAFGDVRQMRQGALRGRARLARHLWRMCFALFIAAGSFFSIEARVATILPWPFTTLPLRLLAIMVPFAAMFFWLWRLRRRRTPPVVVRFDAAPVGRDAT